MATPASLVVLALMALVVAPGTTFVAATESGKGPRGRRLAQTNHGGDVAHIMGRKLTQQTGPYTYSFTVNAVNHDVIIGPNIYYLKLDGVMPSVDQFTVHVAPDRELCLSLIHISEPTRPY